MFPSGLLPLALRVLERAEEPVDTLDTRNISVTTQPNYDIPGFEFRDYQKEAVQAVLTHQRGVLKMATNAGKTLVMAGVLKSLAGKQAIVVVPTRALLAQTADRLESMLCTRLGRYGAGAEEFRTITISTIASMGKLLHQEDDIKYNHILLADECFLAGTMVGSKPIEDIVVGDSVPAWDGISIVSGRVTHTFRRHYTGVLIKISCGATLVYCTPNHPFMTSSGWVLAKDITNDMRILYDRVCSVRSRGAEIGKNMEEGTLILLGGVLEGAQNRNGKEYIQGQTTKAGGNKVGKGSRSNEDPENLLILREGFYTNREGILQVEEKRSKCPSVLHRVVQESICERELKAYGYTNQCLVWPFQFREDVAQQPNEKSCHESEDIKEVEGCGSQTAYARWEWERIASATKDVIRCVRGGLGSRVANSYMCKLCEQSSSPTFQLQGGYSKFAVADSRRSGWVYALRNSCSRAGQEEGRLLDWVRVDSVEVLEQDSTEGIGCVRGEGIDVYNLGVEYYNTYVANGFVVHNCHHGRSTTLFNGIMATPGSYRIGLSGTPLRYNQLDDMKLVGATGEVIYEISNTQLIEAGFSVPPVVIFHTVGAGEEDMREYQEAYRDLLVNNRDRNHLIARVAIEEVKRGPVLIVANWIEHVNAIASVLPAVVSSRIITGNNSSEEMTQALDAVRERKLDILIATEVFGEGIDVPSVATVVLASGGKSHIKMLQRIGRGMRVDGLKDELHVHDFIDDTHRYLLKHSERRYSIYAKEGFRTKLDNATGAS
jgi:superfamily II DNA or RNA helicase